MWLLSSKVVNDRIFPLRQCLEKTHENQIVTFHLFFDHKAEFDSPIRHKILHLKKTQNRLNLINVALVQ